jgi:hypothetical protein
MSDSREQPLVIREQKANELAQLAGFSREDAAKAIESYGPDLAPIAAEMVRHGLSRELVGMLLKEADKVGLPLLALFAGSIPLGRLAGAMPGVDLAGGAMEGLLLKLLPGLLEKFGPQLIEKLTPQLIDAVSRLLTAWLAKLAASSAADNGPAVVSIT